MVGVIDGVIDGVTLIDGVILIVGVIDGVTEGVTLIDGVILGVGVFEGVIDGVILGVDVGVGVNNNFSEDRHVVQLLKMSPLDIVPK